jgi:8-oxo-dGTP pyrophosphatase MutT (NUDIX family)
MGMNAPTYIPKTSALTPAASVIVINERNQESSVLLVHRSPELRFHPDMWAFPGGHIDDSDRVAEDDLQTARRCAVRETAEESGLELKAEDLIHMFRWVSPKQVPRRFDTWFFLTIGRYTDVRVDGDEIIGHTWSPIEQALRDHHGDIRRLTPPVFVLLSRLAALNGRITDRQVLRSTPVTYFKGRLVDLPDGLCTLYEEDEAFRHGDLNRPGPRHRLLMHDMEWTYENQY